MKIKDIKQNTLTQARALIWVDRWSIDDDKDSTVTAHYFPVDRAATTVISIFSHLFVTVVIISFISNEFINFDSTVQ